MFILVRHQNESIIIGDDIRITILSDGPSQIKLGIDAPDDLKILREEVYHSPAPEN